MAPPIGAASSIPSAPLLQPSVVASTTPPIKESSFEHYTAPEIARLLWLDPETIISADMVQKVNAACDYLKERGFQLIGVKADGNCFCHAFLGSYQTLTRKIPLLDVALNKLSFLREQIAGIVEKMNIDRADAIRRDGEWISAPREGEFLAIALSISLRIITVQKGEEGCGINDMLTFPDPKKSPQTWESIDKQEQPKEYILIVDLGGHFVFAEPIASRKIPEISEKVKATLSQIFTSAGELPLDKTAKEEASAMPILTTLPVAVQHSTSERNPLKPLAENPFQTPYPGGWVGISESHPYYIEHSEWCTAVLSRSPEIRGSRSYERKMEDIKKKMSLQDIEEKLSKIEQEYLENIDRAVSKILKELGKPKPDQEVITLSIKTIRENTYQLLMIPITNALDYARSNFRIVMMGQLGFRGELEKTLPTPIESFHRDILDQVYDQVLTGDLTTACEKLEKEYPDSHQIIQALVLKAESLLEQESARATSQVHQYFHSSEINYCFSQIFEKAPHLLNHYAMVIEGRYPSMKEMPHGFSDGNIHSASYTPKLVALLRGCEVFENGASLPEERVKKLKESCDEYLKNQNPVKHFQDTIQPLVFFLECVRNILLWPRKYEPIEDEVKYLEKVLYFLTGISNPSITGRSYILYEFLSVTDENQANAWSVLKKKQSSDLEKRQACRLLFHARIPWLALQAIGSLLHTSGGIPEDKSRMNQRVVRSFLPDLMGDFRTVAHAIEELIEFEVTEFSQPALLPPQPLPEECYDQIYLLGNISDVNRNLERVEEVLCLWRNQPLRLKGFAASKVKHAVLRTLQILGEISKNLRKSKVLSEDEFWDDLEDLRDVLSHSERSIVDKRLTQLIDSSENQDLKYFSDIFEEFRIFLEYFQKRRSAFNQETTLPASERLKRQKKSSKAYLEIKGLRNLRVFLTARIPDKTVRELRQSVAKESAVKAREETLRIKKTLLEGSFDKYSDNTEKLPLSAGQKKELKEAIKTLISPKAAVNNAKGAKHSYLKSLHSIASEWRRNKKLVCDELDQFLALLAEGEKLIDAPDFVDKVNETKVRLDQLKKVWERQQVSMPAHWETVEEYVVYLAENVDDFIARKRETVESILNSLEVYPAAHQTQEKADALIQLMQLGQLPKEDLKVKIVELGVSEDKSLWEQACAISMKKQEARVQEEPQDKDLIPTAKQKALDCIDVISDRLKRLDKLVSFSMGKGGLEGFQQDPLLQLACEHLVSDFRVKASALEGFLELIRQSNPSLARFIQEIQESLLFSIETGNRILHVHDVTEPSTITPHGHIFILFQHVSTLLKNFMVGRESTISMDSLSFKLNKLGELLKRI